MRGWDRLLAREFMPILLQGMGVFSLLVAFAIYFRVVIKMITDFDVGPATVGQFLLLGMPQAVAIAIPMSVLFASLMAFSRLSERG
ncbi:LptF/LptG family permease, partial [bacterium]|nr:LptF/LptG family permease [bacterium]